MRENGKISILMISILWIGILILYGIIVFTPKILKIQSEPPGAEIYFNGKLIEMEGRIPLTNTEVGKPEENTRIALILPGYLPYCTLYEGEDVLKAYFQAIPEEAVSAVVRFKGDSPISIELHDASDEIIVELDSQNCEAFIEVLNEKFKESSDLGEFLNFVKNIFQGLRISVSGLEN